jgi:DNA-binding protein HU-beta
MGLKKSEIIAGVAKDSGCSQKDTEKVIEVFLELAKNEVQKGEEFVFPGFGKALVVNRAERQGINPKTKEKITIPARKSIKFKFMPSLKKILG